MHFTLCYHHCFNPPLNRIRKERDAWLGGSLRLKWTCKQNTIGSAAGISSMTFAASIITLYPEMFPGPLGVSLAGKALDEGAWSLETVALRDFGKGRHKNVDDTPAGGGAGMVLRADVLGEAIDSIGSDAPDDLERPRLLMSPRGRVLDQKYVRELAERTGRGHGLRTF